MQSAPSQPPPRYGAGRGRAVADDDRSLSSTGTQAFTIDTMSMSRGTAPLGLALAFTASGITHLVRPQVFESMMPRLIPVRHHRALIYVSGAAELVCAVGLVRRTRWASPLSIAVLAAVFRPTYRWRWTPGRGVSPRPWTTLWWHGGDSLSRS